MKILILIHNARHAVRDKDEHVPRFHKSCFRLGDSVSMESAYFWYDAQCNFDHLLAADFLAARCARHESSLDENDRINAQTGTISRNRHRN